MVMLVSRHMFSSCKHHISSCEATNCTHKSVTACGIVYFLAMPFCLTRNVWSIYIRYTNKQYTKDLPQYYLCKISRMHIFWVCDKKYTSDIWNIWKFIDVVIFSQWNLKTDTFTTPTEVGGTLSPVHPAVVFVSRFGKSAERRLNGAKSETRAFKDHRRWSQIDHKIEYFIDFQIYI